MHGAEDCLGAPLPEILPSLARLGAPLPRLRIWHILWDLSTPKNSIQRKRSENASKSALHRLHPPEFTWPHLSFFFFWTQTDGPIVSSGQSCALWYSHGAHSLSHQSVKNAQETSTSLSFLCLECKSFSNLSADQALLFSFFWSISAFLYLFASFSLLASGSGASTMMYKVDPLAFSRFDSIFFAQMLSDWLLCLFLQSLLRPSEHLFAGSILFFLRT